MAKATRVHSTRPTNTSANSVTASPDPNVIDMENRREGPETLTSKFGDYDAAYLEWCANWRILRAQQQINWAKHDLATGWGILPAEGIGLSLDPLDQLRALEDRLVTVTPRTVLLAREMLGICVTILAHPEPEANLAKGPVLEIIKNVLAALDQMSAETRFSDNPD